MIECQITYIMSCLKNLVESNGQSMDIRKSSLKTWTSYIYSELSDRVWTTSCKSWYKNEKGIVFVLWPNGTYEYWWKLLTCNLTDYKMTYAD